VCGSMSTFGPTMSWPCVIFCAIPLTQHLPRKFKMSFSGCESDCAQGMIHDLGVVAVHHNGRFGFKLVAGGGLGHKPREAIVVEEFIEPGDLLACMEAVIALHNRYSDRKKRAKSRIKFLVDRFGAEGFVQHYREELERTRTALADVAIPAGQWRAGQADAVGYDNPGAPRGILAQKQAGLNVVPVSIPIGDMTAPQMNGIAELMEAQGLDELAATQDQNLMVFNVPDAKLDVLNQGLAGLGLATPKVGDDVVACPGTSDLSSGYHVVQGHWSEGFWWYSRPAHSGQWLSQRLRSAGDWRYRHLW